MDTLESIPCPNCTPQDVRPDIPSYIRGLRSTVRNAVQRWKKEDEDSTKKEAWADSLDELDRWAIGQLGYSPGQFWDVVTGVGLGWEADSLPFEEALQHRKRTRRGQLDLFEENGVDPQPTGHDALALDLARSAAAYLQTYDTTTTPYHDAAPETTQANLRRPARPLYDAGARARGGDDDKNPLLRDASRAHDRAPGAPSREGV